jgi:hypothetical protein
MEPTLVKHISGVKILGWLLSFGKDGKIVFITKSVNYGRKKVYRIGPRRRERFFQSKLSQIFIFPMRLSDATYIPDIGD